MSEVESQLWEVTMQRTVNKRRVVMQIYVTAFSTDEEFLEIYSFISSWHTEGDILKMEISLININFL